MDELTTELAALAWFESIGLRVISAVDLEDERHFGPGTMILDTILRGALSRLNPSLSSAGVDQTVRQLRNPPHPTLIQNNRWFHSQFVDGIEVEETDRRTGETRGYRARLVDYSNARANEILVVRQLSVSTLDGKTIRPDLTIFLNGIAIAVVELKDPTDPQASSRVAIHQLHRYMTVAPDLFVGNMVLVVSDGTLTRVGTLTSDESRFMPWRPDDGGAPTLEALVRGLFEPSRLVDFLRTCVVFEVSERGDIAKKVAGYHQFRAMRNARTRILDQLKVPSVAGDGRGGVIWHTQGSGKSLTMLMLAGALIRHELLANPTIVVVTDRNDLDDQLFDTFAAGRALLRQDPVQAANRADLRDLLDHASGGVVFTTIQKFAEEHGLISDRSNVVVMADEAHRSQYGFVEGGARWMREALPNATYVGFTGTPLESDDRNTVHVFGECSDVYDIRQAVEDGATKPLYYESRIVQLSINEVGATAAEEKVESYLESAASGRDADESVRVGLEAVVGAPERIDRLAEFVVNHWEQRRGAMEGKALVVTMSRDIAARLYDAIALRRPAWHSDDDEAGGMKVIYSGSSADSEPIRSHVRTKSERKRLAERFKDPHDEFRLAIVCDMWLTGFDCPPAHTMYLDKPLAGHGLMQAIARVNRVYADKPGGLIVDLLGLADQLADALATYSRAGGTGEGVESVQDQAVPAMQSAHEKLRSFFHGLDYERALRAPPAEVLSIYAKSADYVLAQDDGWHRVRLLVKELSAAFALAVPRPETHQIVDDLAFYQRVVAMIQKRLSDDADRGEGGRSDMDAAVRQVVGGAVEAGEVIDLFAAAGLEDVTLDILSEEFLQRVAALEHKNLALETLRKLLNDQIRISERTNVVQGRQFREALEEAMLRYTNKSITTAEMLTRLLELARFVRDAKGRGEELGLSSEESAFYDALAANESAHDVMKDESLRLMARELTEMVRRLPKLDWTARESVRADLRRSVRRLLAKYGYPPDMAENATQLVLRQAELSTEAGR